MQRLLQKFDTAKALVPQPAESRAGTQARHGVIFYGSTSPAMAEAIERLQADGIAVDTLRIRAFPFPESVRGFIDAHESRSEEHTSELQSLMRSSYAVFCLKKKKNH